MAPDADLPAEWGIRRLVPLASGVGGKVWRAEPCDGGTTIVKSPSDEARPEARRAAGYLRWRDGAGAIRLLAEHGDVHLLEYAGETRLLDLRIAEGERTATAIAADVVARLHAPSPVAPPQSLTPLRVHFASLFARAKSDAGIYTDYAAFADRLLDTQKNVQPLHGDLHHENILQSSRGWLAIDPKGLVGDPAYDVANIFHNPPHAPERMEQARIMAVAETLACGVDRDVEAVLSHAFAYSGLSACWWLETGNEPAAHSTLEIGMAVRSALDQIRS